MQTRNTLVFHDPFVQGIQYVRVLLNRFHRGSICVFMDPILINSMCACLMTLFTSKSNCIKTAGVANQILVPRSSTPVPTTPPPPLSRSLPPLSLSPSLLMVVPRTMSTMKMAREIDLRRVDRTKMHI